MDTRRAPCLALLVLLLLLLTPPAAAATPTELAATPIADGPRPLEPPVDLGSLPTHLVEVGDPTAPETVVLVHGGPGIGGAYLRGLFAMAGEGLRVVAYDQRGAGQTPRPAYWGFGLDDYLADLDALRTALGADRVHLVGHSWGGFLAAAYAARYPERVGSLVLIAPMPIPADPDEIEAGFRDIEDRIARLQADGVIPATLPVTHGDDCSAQGDALLPAYLADPAVADRFRVALAGGTCSVIANEQTYYAIPFEQPGAFDDLLAQARGYRGPLLLVFGDRDPFVAWFQPAAAAFPNAQARTETIANAGHFPWVDDPTVVDRLRSFVLETKAAATPVAGAIAPVPGS